MNRELPKEEVKFFYSLHHIQMDEIVFYNGAGAAADKKHEAAFGYLASVHTTKTYQQLRTCPSSAGGAVCLGVGNGSHTVVALPDKPLILVYLYGKETPEQRIPIPEVLSCLELISDPSTEEGTYLLGGSVSGRLYVWSLHSGLLLSVKQPHYQALTHIACHSGFVATASKDSRVVVQTVVSLLVTSNGKPFSILTEHTLPVTSLLFNRGFNNDLKLYTSSLDSTVRCFSLSMDKASLVTTFVAPGPVTALAADPAFRSLYLGLDSGAIRILPLYTTNPKTHVIEAVGGLGKIVTLKEDVDLLDTITSHSEAHKGTPVIITQLQVSFDGTMLVSGDSLGSVFVVDISTKQVARKLKELNGPISNLRLWTARFDDERFERKVGVDKGLVRTIPVLKRTVCEESDLHAQKLLIKFTDETLANSKEHTFNFDSWAAQVKSEEMAFTNVSGVDSNIIGENVVLGATAEETKTLRRKLAEREGDLSQLRAKYDELLKEYSEAVTK